MSVFSLFKKTFRAAVILGAAVLMTAILAESISIFFLPKPTVHKLPMVRFTADPDCGYRLEPNQKAYTLGSLATINKWGFRGKDWEIKKPENTVRIAVLGSSYAFGHGVGDDEMYSAQLETLLNSLPPNTGKHYEVMSFGMGGYDTGHEINTLKTHVLKFNPDIVILSFFFNDIFYISDYGFYPLMFEEQKKNFSRGAWEIRNLMRNSRLAMFLWDEYKEKKGAREPGEVGGAVNAYVREGIMPPKGPQAVQWGLVTERIREFKKLSQEHHFKPVFLVIPTHQEMLEKNINVSYVRYLDNLGTELAMPPLLLVNALKQTGQDLKTYLIPYDFHLSASGHKFMAELLKKEILSA